MDCQNSGPNAFAACVVKAMLRFNFNFFHTRVERVGGEDTASRRRSSAGLAANRRGHIEQMKDKSVQFLLKSQRPRMGKQPIYFFTLAVRFRNHTQLAG